LSQVSGQRIQISYVYTHSDGIPQPAYAAVGGMLQTIHHENPNLTFKTIAVEEKSAAAGLTTILRKELGEFITGVMEIRFHGQQRQVKQYKEFPFTIGQTEESRKRGELLKHGGVYIITGGVGGLGLILARRLAENYRARLVLCDRSPLTLEISARIKEIENAGAEIFYVQTDVTRQEEVKAMIAAVRSRYRVINGIIHCAGALRDALVINKTGTEIHEVVAPKVMGALWLDEETRQEDLDFFFLYSSTSANLGHIGQVDYAYANRFLDEFAQVREHLRANQKRKGKTISINWPWWRRGGMKLTEQSLKLLQRNYGLQGLETETGLQVFEAALASNWTQFMLIVGERDKADKMMQALANREEQESHPLHTGSDAELEQKLSADLKQMVCAILKLPFEQIDDSKKLNEFGFDSITFTTLANEINDRYNLSLSPAKFFEFRTLRDLVSYLGRSHRETLAAHYHKPTESQVNKEIKPEIVDDLMDLSQRFLDFWEPVAAKGIKSGALDEPVAIIGMAGKMPGSADLEIFWRHLAAGKDLVNEIPANRWDWREYYGHPAQGPNKTDVRWGGFLEDIEAFDASFFGISPREAELMDPQQRLFLEIAWKAIEDAGYSPMALSGSRTALFVGVSTNDYNELLKDWGIDIEAHISTGINNSIIANRVSYLLNLLGPSETIDTACSSSLVAMRRGVDCIRSGECEMAIAGGVNVLLRPKFHIAFRKTGMLSENGRCKTFDKQADGYVRSEGVGAVLLKSLDRAKADGDNIYAVIRGIAENHGGRAHSLTAPNPQAQSELLIRAYQQARVPIDSVTYIEAHGTGTHLGDPIEINGMTEAFKQLYVEASKTWPGAKHCGIGAVKTNIGHLESAAGIAGVLKVLLALKFKTLPATVHFRELNPHIHLEDTPFYIVKETRAWECLYDEQNNPIPRRAGISSFGFGGTNVHLVLEEYADTRLPMETESPCPQLVVLSARDEERLREYAGKLAEFFDQTETGGKNNRIRLETQLREAAAEIMGVSPGDIDPAEDFNAYGFDTVMQGRLAQILAEIIGEEVTLAQLSEYTSLESLARSFGVDEGEAPPVSLAGLAYTLLAGREAMNARLALLVNSITEMQDKLRRYAQGETNLAGVYLGNVDPSKKEEQPTVEADKAAAGKDLDRLARLWVAGAHLDWNMLYDAIPPRRLSLPTYPFARERYWLQKPQKRAAAPHILVDHLDLTTGRPTFNKRFNGQEFFIADHSHILPGVVYLEMIRAAGHLLSVRATTFLNVVWSIPIVVSEARPTEGSGKDVRVVLDPKGGAYAFRVMTADSRGHDITHSVGTFAGASASNPGTAGESVDIAAVLGRCQGGKPEADAYYDHINENGGFFGPRFQGIREFYYNRQEALARIEINQEQEKDFHEYILHPTLTDSGIQSMVAFGYKLGLKPEIIYLPYVLNELIILNSATRPAYVYVWVNGDQPGLRPEGMKFNSMLLDKQGQVLVKILGLSLRPLQQSISELSGEALNPGARAYETVYYQSAWKPSPGFDSQGLDVPIPGAFLVFDWDHRFSDLIDERLANSKDGLIAAHRAICVTPGQHFRRWDREGKSMYEIDPASGSHYRQLAESLRERSLLPGIIVHCWSRPGFSGAGEQLRQQLDLSIHSLFHILQAFMNQPVWDGARLFYFYPGNEGDIQPQYAAAAAFLRSAGLESRKFIFKTIETPGDNKSRLLEILAAELAGNQFDLEVRYHENLRFIKTFREFNMITGEASPLKEKGVYLISGGLGGLGLIFARRLARHFKARLVLCGRSDLTEEKKSILGELESLGAEVLYIKTDIAVYPEVEHLISGAKARFGQINGIIHSAGVLRDTFLINKAVEELDMVLAPKVYGTVN
ncbi:MAG: polyketide synthase PksN, partial [Acidobacteriota bacterium]|nr:polyketide synthase PksN [Acidobacteriota bacterium]